MKKLRIRVKRVDKIRSFVSFFVVILILLGYILGSEFILDNGPSRETLNISEFYAKLTFSEEEWREAVQFREDVSSIGERVTSIPNTLVYRYKPAKTKSFTLNTNGFRGEEVKPKEKGELRIGIYGDSKILGIYLAEKNTIPVIVAENLEKLFPDRRITVYNLGVEGYDIRRAVNYAELTFQELKLDFVVFHTLQNDINFAMKTGNNELVPFREGEELFQTLVLNAEDAKRLPLRERSLLLKVIDHAFKSDQVKFFTSRKENEPLYHPLDEEQKKIAGEFPSVYLARLKRASEYFAERGLKTLFVFSPTIQTKHPLSKIEEEISLRNELEVQGFHDFFLTCFNGVLETYIREKPDLVLLDQSRIFDGMDTCFFDGMHYTPEASRISAGNISNKIAEMIR